MRFVPAAENKSAHAQAGAAQRSPEVPETRHAAFGNQAALRRLQRKCSCGGTCSRCRDSAEHEADRVAASIFSGSRHRPAIQRMPPSSEPQVPAEHAEKAGVPKVLAEAGQPLEGSARAFMESRFGYSFDSVRIHNGPAAAASAEGIQARAYTVGNHVVFGAGEYQPRSEAGRRLLAHELTHTVQQQAAPARVMRQPAGQSWGDACSGGATDPCQFSRCTADHITTARADIQRGISLVTDAIAALNANPLTSDTVRAMDWYFVSHDQATVDTVRTRLGCILDNLNDTAANDRFGCHPDYDALAYVCTPSMSPCAQRLTPVCLMDSHFGKSSRERAETVIHECAHRSGMSTGHPNSVEDMYSWTARFTNLSTSDAMQNADSYALFAGAITYGVRVSVLPLISMGGGLAQSLSGGPTTWSYRVYLGAEFQHPVLRVFNPTIGLSLTVAGEPESSGTASPVSPSGIASLVAGLRIANPRPGGAGGFYGSVYGGPSIGFGGASRDARLGAEAGVGIGYRWRFLDISAGAGYLHDPGRGAGQENVLTGTVNVGVIPLF